MRLNYVKEKLDDAITAMVTGPGDVRERLIDAFGCFHTLSASDFPPEYQKEWEWIINELTHKGPKLNHKGEPVIGSCANTMSSIKNSTGSKIAERLLRLFEELEDYDDKGV